MSKETPPYVPDVIRILEGSSKDAFCSEDIRNKAMLIVRSQNDNKICFDCGVRNPSWMSLTLGVFLCLECSGDHRSMGVHLTFVRSATLDSFTPMQIIHTACGGNARAKEFFRKNGMTAKRKDTGGSGARVNYDTPQASKYREELTKDAKHWAEKHDLFPEINAGTPLKSPRPGQESGSKAAADSPPKPFGTQLIPTNLATPKPNQLQTPGFIEPPKQIVAPTTVVVSTPAPAPTIKTVNTALPAANVKQVKAKALDFDFDFDDFEAECNA